MPAPDLRRLLHAAQAAEQRGDHATYCACWGRIDRILDGMLEAPGSEAPSEDPRSGKAPHTEAPHRQAPRQGAPTPDPR